MWADVNHNVRLTFVYQIASSLSNGIWQGSGGLSNFVTLGQHGSVEMLGLLTGVSGICTLLVAIPSGMASDRWRRDGVLRMFGVVENMAIICTTCAVLARNLQHGSSPHTLFAFGGVEVDPATLLLFAAMALWGAARGGGNVVLSSLADSTPTGHRSRVYSLLFSCATAAAGVGPLFATAIFMATGNRWTQHALETAICHGMVLALIPAFTLRLFDDSKALTGAHDDADCDHRGSHADDAERHGGIKQTGIKQMGIFGLKPRHVPYIMAAHDCLEPLAIGMSAKYLTVWFRVGLGLDPASVGVLQAVSPVVTAVFIMAAQSASAKLGRIQTVLAMRVAGALCLLVMGTHQALWAFSWAMIPIVLLRAGLSNSTHALLDSVLMDFVPQSQRGFWNALKDVWVFNWCASAVLGGYIVDWFGFQAIFVTTAILQICAAAILVLLLPLVPRAEAGIATSPGAQAAVAAAEAATAADDRLAAVRVPLLLGTPSGPQPEERR